MDQGTQALFLNRTLLGSAIFAFKYTLERYAKEAGYEKTEKTAQVLRADIRKFEPPPNVPDAIYTTADPTSLAGIKGMLKEVSRAIRPA